MAEIHRQAGRLTPEQNAANHLINKHDLKLPIDVHELALRYADIEEVPFNLRGDAVLVEFPKDHNKPLILLNANRKNQARRRFTLAHELGHILISWHYGNYSCNPSPAEADYYLSGDFGLFEAQANQFAAELLMPTAWALQFVSQPATIQELFENFMSSTGVSPEAARIRLIGTLPPGYICVVESLPGTPLQVACSAGTPSNLIFDYNDRADLNTLTEKIEKMASDQFVLRRSTRTIWWWKVKCATTLPPSTDPRPANRLMRVILDETLVQPALVLKVSQKLNGLVGGNNHAAMSRACEDIYGVLKLRFEKRDVIDNPYLSKFVEHELFEAFLVNKAREIASGQTVKKLSETKKAIRKPPN